MQWDCDLVKIRLAQNSPLDETTQKLTHLPAFPTMI